MATINLVQGINLIQYSYSTPIAFSSLNPTVNIEIIKTPAYDSVPPYFNLQSYLPGSSLNRWLTQFAAISSYLVVAKQPFSYTELGTPVTPPQSINTSAPWAIVTLDANRPSVPIAPFESVLGTTSRIFRQVVNGGIGTFQSYQFLSDLNQFDTFDPGRTYYIYSSNRTTPWTLTSSRINDLLLTDANDFITTEAGDALAA